MNNPTPNFSLIIVGPQGSGKGTQARLIAERFGYTIFETGGELRKMAQEDSDLGRQVKKITTRGDLVPNEIVMEIVQNFVEKNNDKAVLFDGIPRSEEQRQSLDKLLVKNNISYKVVEMAVPIEVCMERMMSRAQIEGRADDTPEAMKNRLKNFFTHTEPLLENWANHGLLITINGNQSPAEVDAETIDRLGLK